MRELAPKCACEKLHPEQIAHAEIQMPNDEELFALADLYKIFGDSTRIRILYVLYDTELCVCDIAEMLGMTLSAISHQLRILRAAKLVVARREGKTVFYTLADDHVRTILADGIEHIHE